MKMLKKGLSVLLALSMLLSLSVTAFADGPVTEPAVNYVALGDSMSQGYMFTDYNENYSSVSEQNHYCGFAGSSQDPEKSYIYAFKEELENEYGPGQVDLTDLSVQGLQPDEVWELLDPEGFEKSYMGRTAAAQQHFDLWLGVTDSPNKLFDNIKEMSAYYTEAIQNADVITYDIGINYFGTSLTDRISENLGRDEHYTRFLADPDSAYGKLIEEMRSSLAETLNDLGIGMVDQVMDTILNQYGSFLYYTDKCMESIYKLNPDVDMVVLGMYSPYRDIYIDVGGIKLNVSNILDLLMDSQNIFLKYTSKYCGAYKFKDYDGKVVNFADELYYYKDATDYKPSVDLKCNLGQLLKEKLEGEVFAGYTEDDLKSSLAAAYATGKPTALIDEMESYMPVFEKAANLRAFTIDQIKGFLGDGSTANFARPFLDVKNETNTATEDDYLLVHGSMLLGASARGFGSHPCPRGLMEKADAAIKAYHSEYAANGTPLTWPLLAPVKGEFALKLNYKDVGCFTFAKQDGKWSIQNADGKYLTVGENGKLALTDEQQFCWSYSLGAFYTTKTIAGHFSGLLYIPKSIETRYLSTVTEGATLSLLYTNAKLYRIINHDYRYVNNKNGTHTAICHDCGKLDVQKCVYDETTGKCICGAVDPAAQRIKVTVEKSQKVTGGLLKHITYTAVIKTNPAAAKVEYSTNSGLSWTKGDTITSTLPILSFLIRVTSENGTVWYYNCIGEKVIEK